ncbi:NAD(P)/FAD-dependent oxidoreductase [Marinomonas transparens]|uniref:NAD(P)/FAD-dependent oxidoreductase n=1 Tax=Marinomonas transparens TaxID=2795388 RepID=A0A934JM34_9GAMM|nr:NAD(P)/FAD-dependent oxidoreductase [Marinomonas transparens]MBJ7538695.1 NAD(P)/FAD-dependent oxidoreductase [Marinomonas transparens]
MEELKADFDAIVIGAGPAGAMASSLLVDQGHNVLVLEKQHFPRFSIGESLLPQSMEFLEAAGMLQAVVEAGFQYKNGAAFSEKDTYSYFDFRKKFSPGWGTTYQVQRAQFDKVLADCAQAKGADIRYGHSVTAFEENNEQVQLSVSSATNTYKVTAKFVLDASGFGRVLPKLLALEKDSALSPRVSLFTHIEDQITDPQFDRNKILISVHPENKEIWYWLIPFSNGRASVGVVLPRELYDNHNEDNKALLQHYIGKTELMNKSLANAQFDSDVGKMDGYSCNVKSLYGDKFALLGNAGEFLDPVFSSGVTIALKSATLAAQVLNKQLKGETVDWQAQYAQPLQKGIDTFRVFVESWYDGSLQDVIFKEEKSDAIEGMISSILAGYAWDTKNPYVKTPTRLKALAELCRG